MQPSTIYRGSNLISSITVESSIEKWKEQPICLHFSCKRRIEPIDRVMEKIYLHTIKNQFNRLLTPIVSCEISEIKHYGNSRGSLRECSCDTLNRLESDLRNRYECTIMQMILSVIKLKPFCRQLNLVVFASDGLHSELVILLKLIAFLRDLPKISTWNICLFLINCNYQDSIERSISLHQAKDQSWESLISDKKEIIQFLKEISLCLSPQIKVDCFILSDPENYTQMVEKNSRFSHDLLLGIDVEEKALENFVKEDTFGVFLMKNPEGHGVYFLQSSKGQFEFISQDDRY